MLKVVLIIATFMKILLMIDRWLKDKIRLDPSKKHVILIKGPRNSGKSVLLRALFSEHDPSVHWIDGDCLSHREFYSGVEMNGNHNFMDGKEVIIIEQVQRFEDPARTIHQIFERFSFTHLVITASVSIDLFSGYHSLQDFNYEELILHPVSYTELTREFGKTVEDRFFEDRLRFGCYPVIVEDNHANRMEIMNSLIDDFLCKDLFANDRIKKNAILTRLLKLLAERIGEIISFNDLAKNTGVDKETIERYIDALERAYIIFQLNTFSGNSKLELKKSRKIYFFDNGIRNAILSDFSPIHERKDVKVLIENYLLSERVKYNYSRGYFPRLGFWKTVQQLEVSYLEQGDHLMEAFVLHDINNLISRSLKAFSKSYPEAQITRIDPKGISKFISNDYNSYENEKEYNNKRINTRKDIEDQSEWEVD